MAEVTDIVERVARAIAIADAKPGQHPLLLTSENYMSATRKLARAALAAMLEAVGEPTEAMLLDGVDAWHNAEPCLLDEQLALVWKAMLAASPLYSLAALREALPPPPQD